MKIAIHHRGGSFSERWIEYCNINNVEYELVNCYDSDIVKQLEGFDGLLWHWSHNDYKAAHFARQLTCSLEMKGLEVFPNSNTAWHFDDKIGQKYLLESVNASLVPSYVFYEKQSALIWLETSPLPIVFKLKNGAGSFNVVLIKTKRQAKKLINKAFNKGFPFYSKKTIIQERLWRLKRDKSFKGIVGIGKGIIRAYFPTADFRIQDRQKGYVYFQKFIPNNTFDIRIVVVGNKAIGLKRMVRKGDFRASGSGIINYNPDEIDIRCVELSFQYSKVLKLQSVAFDFVFDENDNPLIVEISYGFATKAYDKCPGYWERNLNWHKGFFNPQFEMISNLIREITI